MQRAQHGQPFIHMLIAVPLHGTGEVASVCGDGEQRDKGLSLVGSARLAGSVFSARPLLHSSDRKGASSASAPSAAGQHHDTSSRQEHAQLAQ